MSNQYNTVWQRHDRDKRYQATLRECARVEANEDGWWNVRTVTRIVWTKTSCTLYYEAKGVEYHRNIIQYVRRYLGRLNDKKRAWVVENAPKEITIHTYGEPCYMQWQPYNLGVRYYHEISASDLKEWLSKYDESAA